MKLRRRRAELHLRDRCDVGLARGQERHGAARFEQRACQHRQLLRRTVQREEERHHVRRIAMLGGGFPMDAHGRVATKPLVDRMLHVVMPAMVTLDGAASARNSYTASNFGPRPRSLNWKKT